ncbi:hypothetical protein QVD17_38197 [Tagetes erecta]|uniref:Uncharacterized protein n=1 Tax=Tagetes erecta TaxID=13708 RepID=A0AAD8K1X8_TARER|nr:hypothetical protein QVD17_38197 [Tagetes erecta]
MFPPNYFSFKKLRACHISIVLRNHHRTTQRHNHKLLFPRRNPSHSPPVRIAQPHLLHLAQGSSKFRSQSTSFLGLNACGCGMKQGERILIQSQRKGA